MPEPLVIIIDTREQTPWAFPEWQAVSRRGTLAAGDYAVEGDERFAIERKSLEDFLGTISTGWARFRRELSRMRAGNHVARCILVEGDFEDVCFTADAQGIIQFPRHRHFNLSPQFVASRIAELTLDGVSVLLAGNADYASQLAYRILLRRHLHLSGIKTDEP